MSNEIITAAANAQLSLVEHEERTFELAQRRAKVYAASSLVPKEYQGNIANVMIAQNMAQRLGADLLQVMQNLYVVHGRPGWSSQFLIATFNTCGRFSAIRYRFTGERGKPNWGCVAYTTEIGSGDVIEGTEVTMEMAEREGWSTKAGSKWKTMPEQMLRYRSAAFLVRTVAPEVSMGLLTLEEVEDSQQRDKGTPSLANAALLAAIQPEPVAIDWPEVEPEAEDEMADA